MFFIQDFCESYCVLFTAKLNNVILSLSYLELTIIRVHQPIIRPKLHENEENWIGGIQNFTM